MLTSPLPWKLVPATDQKFGVNGSSSDLRNITVLGSPMKFRRQPSIRASAERAPTIALRPIGRLV